ncbi:biorientation of chromosomes in cell division protein 1-like 1 [Galendromus occidentalis]|uniref:Biorientation of chromosomes in cell division protein 1-like 1 n=1 Tax=Galendromus occidentalis TaxID=34638 RepID=A0AAJ7L304_9ACAR|nr:biorientation of chromosomes in cell division protein 1-like 1 [Galendromus occidentalis]
MSSFEIETLKTLPPCHPQLVEAIITQIKSQGLFDDFRKSCLSDIDTKPSYLNLKQRVEGYVNKFLSRQKWSSALQKNQLRDTLRKDINESGLLKTGLDHLVDQLLYAHAEKSIRPKVRAEIKKFLNLTDPSEQQSVLQDVPNYSIAPPHYGPPAMPPLPPVPPPPDVTGVMIDTFGNLKPPEPPSPHGSEYSVDMSDSSMVGRDEAPPALPKRSTNQKSIDPDGSEALCDMDLESKGSPHQPKLGLDQCSSPEIFEEVSEEGSLGGTPVRDEDASDPKSRSFQARTDFTGLFKDCSRADQPICDETEVIIDEENMVFEVSEECVKTEESTKLYEEAATPTADEEVLSMQGDDLEQANVTPIMDEAPEGDDDMEISSDAETQCEDEVQSLLNGLPIEDKNPQTIETPRKSPIEMGTPPPPECEAAYHESMDADLSNTQPPLQIDTEDTGNTVIEKTQLEAGQDTERTSDIPSKLSDSPPSGVNKEETQVTDFEVDREAADPLPEALKSEKLEPDSSDENTERASVAQPRTKSPEAPGGEKGSNPKDDAKHKERKSSSSSHHKSSSRSESDRDRHREHKSSSSSHHGSSSRSKKVKDHHARNRDRDGDKREDRKDKERDRKKDRDRERHRDRGHADSKHRSSSHSRSKHPKSAQPDKRREEERKKRSSGSSKGLSRSKSGENSPVADAGMSDTEVKTAAETIGTVGVDADLSTRNKKSERGILPRTRAAPTPEQTDVSASKEIS